MTTTLHHSVRKCQAADPSSCRFHGSPKVSEGALGLYKSFMRKKALMGSSGRVVSEGSPVDVALSSSLKWDGVVPAWFGGFKSDLEGQGLFACSPEVLDVVSSPVGDVAVVWENFSSKPGEHGVMVDSGMHIRMISYRKVDGGQIVGYVKLTSVDEESFVRSFGDDEFTEFRFEERFGGGNYDFVEPGKKGLERHVLGYRGLTGEALLEKRREVWLEAQQDRSLGDASTAVKDANGKTLMAYQVSREHVPSDEKVLADLKVFRKQIGSKMEEFKKSKDVPYIDFSHVDPPLKGKGFGSGLYIAAARKLAEDGLFLRGSGIQSFDAKTLWGKFKTVMPDNVGVHRFHYKGNDIEEPTLDFRV